MALVRHFCELLIFCESFWLKSETGPRIHDNDDVNEKNMGKWLLIVPSGHNYAELLELEFFLVEERK